MIHTPPATERRLVAYGCKRFECRRSKRADRAESIRYWCLVGRACSRFPPAVSASLRKPNSLSGALPGCGFLRLVLRRWAGDSHKCNRLSRRVVLVLAPCWPFRVVWSHERRIYELRGLLDRGRTDYRYGEIESQGEIAGAGLCGRSACRNREVQGSL